MQYVFFTLAVLCLVSDHSGAAFLVGACAMLYYAKDKNVERADLVGGSVGMFLLSLALWAVGSF